ncbi:MAG TPA: phosphotransferase [Vicinamibacterales bacterium]|nr:phosphotransferase [Vicinamibacterales bacterium]
MAAAGLRPTYVRYKPGTRCLVAYEVGAGDTVTYVHANAYPLDRVHRRAGDIVVEGGLVVGVFPHDRALPSLAPLWDPAVSGRVLSKLFPGRPSVRGARLTVIAYKPGRRCVMALREDAAGAAVLKAYTGAGFGHAGAGARAFRSAAPLGVASVAGRSRRHRLLAFQWMPGENLSGLVARGCADEECLARVGAALAALHAQRGDGLRPGVAAVGDDLAAVARGVGRVCPQWAEHGARLAARLSARLQRWSGMVPLHGDFYPGQVLVTSDVINVVDLDRAGLGDPRVDLASFLGRLEWDALDGRLDAGTARGLGDAFLGGYEEATGRSLRGGLEPFVAAALLRLAPHPFRMRHPDWPARVAAVLGRSEALLGRAPRGRPRRQSAAVVSDPFGVLADRGLLLPATVLDGATMADRLGELTAFRGRSVAVKAIRVTRHKPGRRCLIEYDLSVTGGAGPALAETIIAKARAKGADGRAYGLARALWQNGFGTQSADGVSVPRPLGLLPDLKMWVQRKVPGRTVTSMLCEPGALNLASRVAEAIAKLHGQPAGDARRHGIEEEMRILGERLGSVPAEMVAPGRAEEILLGCARLAGVLPSVPPRSLHRDFYPDQIIDDGGRLYLLDLDLHAAGDPALDVGNFLAHVAEHSLRVLGDANGLAAFEGAMTRRFLEIDTTVPPASIRIYRTLALARLIQISTVLAERRRWTAQVVALVERELSSGIVSSSDGDPRARNHFVAGSV